MKKTELNEELLNTLISNAVKAMDYSYSPYSNFAVGACLLSQDGNFYCGSNVENSSFGASNCAERTAIFKAISEGKTQFSAIAIAGGKNKKIDDYCFPCGICRQVLSEFCKKDFIVIVAKNKKDYKIFTLDELLPASFNLN